MGSFRMFIIKIIIPTNLYHFQQEESEIYNLTSRVLQFVQQNATFHFTKAHDLRLVSISELAVSR